MDMEIWIPLYKEIVNDLGFSVADDLRATEDLLQLISGNRFITDTETSLNKLRSMIRDHDCLLIGGGPTLEDDVKDLTGRLEKMRVEDRPIMITADGSTSVLISEGIVPDVIITDLDGGINDQVKAVGDGSIMLLHAHGDNREVVRRTVGKLSGMVIPSTQIDPESMDGAVNFGGFTDGDRAAHMADSLGASAITLLAYDTSVVAEKIEDGGVRRGQHQADTELKRRKLRWADRLLNMISKTPLHHYGDIKQDPPC